MRGCHGRQASCTCCCSQSVDYVCLVWAWDLVWMLPSGFAALAVYLSCVAAHRDVSTGITPVVPGLVRSRTGTRITTSHTCSGTVRPSWLPSRCRAGAHMISQKRIIHKPGGDVLKAFHLPLYYFPKTTCFPVFPNAHVPLNVLKSTCADCLPPCAPWQEHLIEPSSDFSAAALHETLTPPPAHVSMLEGKSPR